MYKFYYNSPIGLLEISVENDAVTSIKMVEKRNYPCIRNSLTKKTEKQLSEYFEGKRRKFDLKLSLYGTDFQKKVWNSLINIEYGKTKSYSEIAKEINHKNAQRAVGNACNKNPIPIIIPCHRVITKNGNSGGFAYGKEIKQKLLSIEKSKN